MANRWLWRVQRCRYRLLLWIRPWNWGSGIVRLWFWERWRYLSKPARRVVVVDRVPRNVGGPIPTSRIRRIPAAAVVCLVRVRRKEPPRPRGVVSLIRTTCTPALHMCNQISGMRA